MVQSLVFQRCIRDTGFEDALLVVFNKPPLLYSLAQYGFNFLFGAYIPIKDVLLLEDLSTLKLDVDH